MVGVDVLYDPQWTSHAGDVARMLPKLHSFRKNMFVLALTPGFPEAAEAARRYYPEVQVYYNRKLQKTNRMTAHTAVAHKLARASYYIMKDQVPFDMDRLFES